jgi:hypothetical protein
MIMDIDIAPYVERLSAVYDEIDREYDETARFYDNFSCAGCEDNCCQTVFYHHTLIENLYLIEGFEGLAHEKKKASVEMASDYLVELSTHPFDDSDLSLMCPLNVDGLCILFRYRPLICRIHGLPGTLSSMRKGDQHWEGCGRFETRHGKSISREIDRTPFYTKIASIEGDLRKEMVFVQKYKKTIAEMILDQTKDEITLTKKMGPEDFHKDSHIL